MSLSKLSIKKIFQSTTFHDMQTTTMSLASDGEKQDIGCLCVQLRGRLFRLSALNPGLRESLHGI